MFVACRQGLLPLRPAGASLDEASLLASQVRNLWPWGMMPVIQITVPVRKQTLLFPALHA